VRAVGMPENAMPYIIDNVNKNLKSPYSTTDMALANITKNSIPNTLVKTFDIVNIIVDLIRCFMLFK